MAEAALERDASRYGFNPYVHGARGLFAGFVFMHHIANSGLPSFAPFTEPVVHAAFLSLQFGVELFFGISGIVILGAISRSPSLAAFAWDRATRILPVLWASLLVITAFALFGRQPLPTAALWLANFLPPPPFFLIPQINPAAWSLGYELSFYLLVAIAFRYRAHKLARIAMIALGIGLTIILPRAILMLPGLLIARHAVRSKALARLTSAPGLWLILFFICWTVTSLMQFDSFDVLRIFGPPYLPLDRWAMSLAPMLIGGVAGALALDGIYCGRGLLSRLLVTPPLMWLGTVSYSFYLWHPIGVAIAKRGMVATGLAAHAGGWSQLILFLAALPPCLIMAFASQRLIETRLTRWLRRYGPRKRAGPVDRFLAAHKRPSA